MISKQIPDKKALTQLERKKSRTEDNMRNHKLPKFYLDTVT